MRKMAWFLNLSFIVISFFLINPQLVSGQVVINEVLNNPEGSESGAEWVELYNKSAEPISLKDCTLYLDDDTLSQKVTFDSEEFIDKYKVILWDHSWLNNSGDQIKLTCVSYEDLINYGDVPGSLVLSPDEGISFGRSPDGSANFFILSSLTMGQQNSQPPTSTPLPTNLPTPSPKLTNTPTQLPLKHTTLSPTRIPSVIPSDNPKQSDVLGSNSLDEESDKIGSQSGNLEAEEIIREISPTPVVLSDKTNKKIPIISGIFIVPGIFLLAYSVFVLIKKFKKGSEFQKSSDDE